MRPRTDMLAVEVLRRAMPQFETYYLDLREIYGEDLTPEVVFNEFADFVERLLDDDEEIELIERCFAAVEEVARTEGVDVLPVVGYSFLDAFRPDTLDASIEYLGPVTERLLRRMAQEWWEFQDERISREDLADIEDLVERGYLSSAP